MDLKQARRLDEIHLAMKFPAGELVEADIKFPHHFCVLTDVKAFMTPDLRKHIRGLNLFDMLTG